MRWWIPLCALIACGEAPPASPPAAPVAPPASVAPIAVAPTVAPEPAPAPVAGPWPAWAYRPVPDATWTAPEDVAAIAVGADGAAAWIATGAGARVWRWTFGADAVPIDVPELAGRQVDELAPWFFGHGAYVLSHDADDWEIGRLKDDGGVTYTRIHTSTARLADLTAPSLRYTTPDGGFDARDRGGNIERLYASVAAGDAWQVIAVRDDGNVPYEVTSPTGAATARFPALHIDPDDYGVEAPRVTTAASARVVAVSPADGALVWRVPAGALARVPYDSGNWGRSAARPGAIADGRAIGAPNGWYLVSWKPGAAGIRWTDPSGVTEVTAADRAIDTLAPTPDGRRVIVASGAVVSVIDAPALAAVRYLPLLEPDADTVAALARDGWIAQATKDEQIYGPYHRLRYPPCFGGALDPVYATLDGFLEVLHAGFEAVFVERERTLSRPRLQVFLAALRDRADAQGQSRVSDVAKASLALLAGTYTGPDAAAIRAGTTSTSALLGEVDFADFRARGPYATEEELTRYFQAFKYVDRLVLTDAERAAIVGDPALEQAWRDWTSVQTAMAGPGRLRTWFAPDATLPAWVRADCVPERVRQAPPRLFPLAWGVDREILEATVHREGVAADCTVPGRLLPDGRDLLAGLGDPDAAAWAAADDPRVADAHRALAARFAGPLDETPSIAAGWIEMVRLLATDSAVPERISADVWQRRLAETALASWASLRHTTVLVDEQGGAECGEGIEAFELVNVEVAHGVVDPLPDAWRATGRMLDRIAGEATDPAVAKVLRDASVTATEFGAMAEVQMAGGALTEEQYAKIQDYAGAIEWRYLKLRSAHQPTEGIVIPDPMTKIVDVQRGGDAILHAAVGHPQVVVALLGDRGVIVPASGAVYSYYEVVADRPLDDAAWREQLPTATRPAWTVLGRVR